MKSRNVWLAIVFLCALGLVARAEVAVTTAVGNGADTYLTNDSQEASSTVHGTDVRIRAFRQLANTRSKTGFVRFDLTGVDGDPNGAFITLALTYQKGGEKTVDIYGLVDGPGDFWDESTTNYDNAPGVLPTTLGNLLLDATQTELLGTLTTPGVPEPNQFSTIPTVAPIENFIAKDTNGMVTFIFVGTDNENEVASKERTDGLIPPTLTMPNEATVSRAYDPVPAMFETLTTDPLDLNWTNPDPNTAGGVITCDVYFGDTEPNALLPHYGLSLLASGVSGGPVAAPALEQFKTYYWMVDTYDTSRIPQYVEGKAWSFNTNNSAPVVNAGPDQYSDWLTRATDVADTYLREGAARGDAAFMDVRGGGTDFAGYLRFDLSALSGAAISNASLVLTVSGGASRNDTVTNGRFALYGLNSVAGNTPQSWDEATLEDDGANPPGQEWDDVVPMANALTNGWITDLDDNVTGITEVCVGGAPGDTITISGAPLAAFLQSRLDDDGLATFILCNDDGSDRGYGIATKENTNTAWRPALVLTTDLPNNGDALVQLDGTATDDGLPGGTLDLTWTQVSGPDTVTVSPDNIEDPTVQIGVPGYYVFQLEATDGQLTSSDTVQVYIGTSPCDTAQNDPAYVPYASDFNSDCMVNMTDLASFVSEWLGCTSLQCP